jgi:uncharacterized membrane protein YccC
MNTTPATAEAPRSEWHQAARELAQAWGPTAAYVVKTSVAAIAALWIAYRLNFQWSFGAALTVFVLAAPQTGKVLEKSLYRLLGTLVGLVAALVIVGLFAEHRLLFIGSMALWIGVCTVGASARTGATFFRNSQGYGFIVAGFIAVLIGFLARRDPTHALQVGIGFTSAAALGILCLDFVSLSLFPQHLSPHLMEMARNNSSRLYRTIAEALRRRLSAEETERHQGQFMAGTFQLESSRSGAVFEDPAVRARGARLQRLNAHFMTVTSTLNVLERRGRRASHDNAVAIALHPLTEDLIAALLPGGTPPQNAVEAESLLPRLRALRAGWPERLAAQRAILTTRHYDHFDDTAQLLRQLLVGTIAYTDTYAALHRRREAKPRPRAPYRPSVDPLLLLLNGVRAALALVLVSAFWIVTAWPSGFFAIIIAGVFSALICTFPNPVQVLPRMLKGFLLGFAAGAVYRLWLIPQISDFPMLAACLLPFIVPGLIAQTKPKYAATGLGYLVMFSLSALYRLNGPPRADAPTLFNLGIAVVAGLVAALLAFTVLVPDRRLRGAARHLSRQRAALARLCREPLYGLRHWFESTTRDRLQAQIPPASPRSVAAALATLELGDAILNLRRALAGTGLPDRARTGGEEALAAVLRLLAAPGSNSRARTLNALHRVNAALEPSPDMTEDPAMRRVRLAIQRLQGVLADEAAVAPWMPPKEHADAA